VDINPPLEDSGEDLREDPAFVMEREASKSMFL
jgi:hypothetical protein